MDKNSEVENVTEPEPAAGLYIMPRQETVLPLEGKFLQAIQKCIDAICNQSGHGEIVLTIVQNRFYGMKLEVSTRFPQEKLQTG